MFRHLPESVFMEDKRWYKVTNLKVNKLSENTSHLLKAVKKYVSDWSLNSDLNNNLFPDVDELYYFGEVDEVEYSLFPFVFYCQNQNCNNVHEYYSIEDISRKNPELRCQFCKKSNIKQYPYALIHKNGDLQSISVKKNKNAKKWYDKYDGIRMKDTRRFTTATWYNYKNHKSLGELGTKTTQLPITNDMKKNNQRFLGGTHLAEGDIHYPALLTMVNLEQEKMIDRRNNENFPFIQMAGLLGLNSIKTDDYGKNFELKNENDTIQAMLNSASNESEREIILNTLKKANISTQYSEEGIIKEINDIFNNEFPKDNVVNDRLLHEFLYTWYENGGQTLNKKIEESSLRGDYVQETTLFNAKKELGNLGIEEVALLEKFPVITLGIGYTRKSFDRNKSILNPFSHNISSRPYTLIPVLKNENEAIVFKMDALRIYKWLELNSLIEGKKNPENSKEAHTMLYSKLELAGKDKQDLAMMDPSDYINNKDLFATIITFQLTHTLMHMLLHAGKSIIGLDVDSMAEYIFPSALSGAIYVSKLQGGGMGALIAAFENDLERWIRNTYEKSQTCLYDPICKGQQGACHACSYLKFSCDHFNRALSRNLLMGGNIGGKEIVGFYSKKLDDFMN